MRSPANWGRAGAVAGMMKAAHDAARSRRAIPPAAVRSRSATLPESSLSSALPRTFASVAVPISMETSPQNRGARAVARICSCRAGLEDFQFSAQDHRSSSSRWPALNTSRRADEGVGASGRASQVGGRRVSESNASPFAIKLFVFFEFSNKWRFGRTLMG